MAAIITVARVLNNETISPQTTLSASDTFVFDSRLDQKLILQNGTAGAMAAITLTCANAVQVVLIGHSPAGVAAGVVLASLAVSSFAVIPLREIKTYLLDPNNPNASACTITGASGAKALLFNE